jgi:hypothetical protein
MANPVLILHGWSDRARSFVPLKEWLVRQGRRTEEVFLGDYESMEDHVTFDDLADGLQTRLDALKRQGKITLAPFSLDVIVHSTGGPVVRHWLNHHVRNACGGDRARCPIARLIMLAPANFGSRLAAQGKTALAKVFRGGLAHGFMTGRRILEGLELGSPVLWQMAENDLFCDAPVYPTEARGPWVFVFSGVKTYSDLKGFVAKGAAEDGSDGTIRAAAAALDSVRFRIDYTEPAAIRGEVTTERTIVSVERSKSLPVAFRLVEGVNHSEIVPENDEAPVLGFIRSCLEVADGAAYEKLRKEFAAANTAFYAEQAKLRLGSDDRVHAYQQFIIRVRDDMGNDVDDYRLDFHVVDADIARSAWDPRDKGDAVLAGLKKYQRLTQRLNEEVIVDVVPHTVNRAYRTFFVNLDHLAALQAELPEGAFIGLNLDASGPTADLSYDTDGLRYLPAVVQLPASDGTMLAFFAANTSTLVEFVVQRVPSDRIFRVDIAAR